MGELIVCDTKADDLVFRIVDSKQRVKELEQVLDACEQNNAQHIKRIMALEQLCKDLYLVAREGYIGESLHNRLVELGFAEGSE